MAEDNYPQTQSVTSPVNNMNTDQNNHNHYLHNPQNTNSLINNDTPRSYRDSTNLRFGCNHYSRNCWLRAECCDEWFVCRFCHDEANETPHQNADIHGINYNNSMMQYKPHKINRYSTKYIKCMQCGTEQHASKYCTHCSINHASNPINANNNDQNSKEEKDEDEDEDIDIATTSIDTRYCFAKYYCDICKLYDNDDGKSIFHCMDCGLCRIGAHEDYIHCKKCNCCLRREYYSKHPCIENSLKSACPICFAYLFTSREPICFFMNCGHPLHYHCLMKYFEAGNSRCPICRTAWNEIVTLKKDNHNETSNQLNDMDAK